MKQVYLSEFVEVYFGTGQKALNVPTNLTTFNIIQIVKVNYGIESGTLYDWNMNPLPLNSIIGSSFSNGVIFTDNSNNQGMTNQQVEKCPKSLWFN